MPNENYCRVVYRNVDNLGLGRNNANDLMLHDNGLLIVGWQDSRSMRFCADLLEGVGYLLHLVRHGEAQSFGPFKIVGHALQYRGKRKQGHYAAIPMGVCGRVC
ncbi:MAG: hypothetical protein AMXMBFR7_43460 [Planctomycetota bacterium]